MFKRQDRNRERVVRMFRKKKVDLKKNITECYIENGWAYVSCNVSGIQDIIDPYSVEGHEWLKPDFVHFIEDNAYYIPIDYPILLEICGVRFGNRDQETIRTTIKRYYSLRIGDMQDDIHNSMKRIILFSALSVLFLALDVLSIVYHWPQAVIEILGVLFWFFIWEAGDNLIYEMMESREKKAFMAQMDTMEVKFVRKFNDQAMSEKESEILLEKVLEKEEALQQEAEEEEVTEE